MMSTSTARVVENVTQSLTVLFRTTPTWAPSTHDKLTIIFQKVSCRWFFLPAGIQLKDFIALHTVLRDKTDDGLLNVQKMIRLAHIMSPLLPGHSSQPPIQPNMDLIKMLRVREMGSCTQRKLKGGWWSEPVKYWAPNVHFCSIYLNKLWFPGVDPENSERGLAHFHRLSPNFTGYFT